MAVDMTPKEGDYSINLPVTFDYKGGRSDNKKGKIILSIIIIVLEIFAFVIILKNTDFEIWQKCLYCFLSFYIGLLILRFVVFKESYFSDIYESLKEVDYKLDKNYIWQIFDIDEDYPYICYFRNGMKGIFVRMEKDTIIGKTDSAMFTHYDSIGDAYNIAHSLNMNIVHIDYMDNVGNDERMKRLYDDLSLVSNPDMYEMLKDIYDNLQDEMSRNYASFDIYLFLTRDNLKNFVYNVQSVANRMLGGNFITYKVLDRYEIAKVCTAIFNLHDFSVIEACDGLLSGHAHSGIVPIKVIHANGEEEVLGKTVEEKRILAEEARKLEEQKKKRRKGSPSAQRRSTPEKRNENEELNLFGEDNSTSKSDSDEDLRLF